MFVTLTLESGVNINVNMARVNSFYRNPECGTTIVFSERGDDFVDVEEDPADIAKALHQQGALVTVGDDTSGWDE